MDVDARDMIQKRATMKRGEQDIEDQIDRRVTDRIGWPKLPVLHLWTCLDNNPTTHIPDYEKRLEYIKKILRARGVDPKQVTPCYRLPYGVTAKEASAATATLLIVTEPDGGDQFGAVRDIRKYLASHECHVCIEILDGKTFHIRTFPILPSETRLVRLWTHSLRNTLIKILDRSHRRWTSINFYHRGYENQREKCPATVVIGAVDPSDPKWKQHVIPLIRSACQDDLPIEIIHQNVTSFETTENADTGQGRSLNPRHFTRRIYMGASCGTEGSGMSATFGGMIRLQQYKIDQGLFALSTHHGMLTEELEKATSDGKPLKPSDPLVTNQSLKVKAPSNHDTAVILEASDLHIKETEALLAREEERASGVKNWFSTERKARKEIVHEVRFELAEIKSMRAGIADFERHAGHLYASSGSRTAEDIHCPLDWSLTKLTPKRNMKNGLHNREVPGGIMPSNMNTWRNIDFRGRPVTKFGRSSHWTNGTVNGVDSVFSGVELPYTGKFTSWPIVPESESFAQPGDCGALVLDAEDQSTTQGTWLGLLSGANTVHGIGYFTPIQQVFKDIEHITRCEIAEPVEVPG